MSNSPDPSFQKAMNEMSTGGLLVGHRLISSGDEFALLTEEAKTIGSNALEVRRASGAARIVGRQLLARFRYPETALPKDAAGAPQWPEGVVGSLAHDARVAVAAVARSGQFSALGIDIEPAEFLPSDMLSLVATPRERRRIDDDPYLGRLLFTAKEAVYKAVHPLDHVFLEHHDIEVSLAERKAVVRNGWVVQLRFCVSSHLVALAFAPQFGAT
jgi:4'-phosphopantetheinyl transferase EntD